MEESPFTPENTSLFQLNFDAANSSALRNAASWAKLTGVIAIILGAIFGWITIVAIGQSTRNEYDHRRSEGFNDLFRGSGTSNSLGIMIIFITCVVFVLGGVFSWSFGNKINTALRANDQARMNAGFTTLRNYYALRAIVLIIVLLLFLLGFAGSLGMS